MPPRRRPLRRSPLKGRRGRVVARDQPLGSDFPPDVRQAIFDRDGGCVAHRLGFAVDLACRGRPHAHHVVLRSQGGEGTLDNGLTLCALHHDYAHSFDRAGAEAAGIIRRV